MEDNRALLEVVFSTEKRNVMEYRKIRRILQLYVLGFLSVLSTAVGSTTVDNPVWPWQCGSNVIGAPHEIVKYLRWYPSKATAIRNTVLHLPAPGVVLPFDEKHDNYDILSGFVPENETGTFRHVVYISDPIKEKEPLSIVVPLWFPNDIVDREDFKLRNAAGVAPNPFDPDIPGNSDLPRGGGMLQGATNYPCIVRIGEMNAEGTKTLVYVQGYVFRKGNLTSYFSPL